VDVSGEETDSVRAAIDDPRYQPWYRTERNRADLSSDVRLGRLDGGWPEWRLAEGKSGTAVPLATELMMFDTTQLS
jgi:hypothetical protein